MDVEALLCKTGYPVKELRFLKPPAFPYLVYRISEERRGGDNGRPLLIEQAVTVELYSEDKNADAEALLEALLEGLDVSYSKNRTWIDSESMYMSVYEFELVEKRGERNGQ